MSASRFTASVTSASSSGRIANIKKIGLVGSRADHVAQQAEAVLVAPLQIVDQDRERRLGGHGPERDGAQIERAKEPAVRAAARRALDRPGPTSRRGHARARSPTSGRSAGDRRGGGRSDDRARQQERAAELLVGGHGDRGEPGLRCHLAGGEQQPRLADARARPRALAPRAGRLRRTRAPDGSRPARRGVQRPRLRTAARAAPSARRPQGAARAPASSVPPRSPSDPFSRLVRAYLRRRGTCEAAPPSAVGPAATRRPGSVAGRNRLIVLSAGSGLSSRNVVTTF